MLDFKVIKNKYHNGTATGVSDAALVVLQSENGDERRYLTGLKAILEKISFVFISPT